MNHFWYANIKDQELKDEFKATVLNSKPVLDRALEYVHHKAEGSYPQLRDYSLPNWDYIQADRNGYLRALLDMETFLNVNKSITSIKSTWLTKTKPKKRPFLTQLKRPLLWLLRKSKQMISWVMGRSSQT